LEELLAGMPTDTGMGFVIVTHQHPGHTSLLPELLGKITALPVVAAGDGQKVQPNHVYVGPSGGHLALLHGVLHRMETKLNEAPHLPIDYFFRSLAEDQKEKAICIILSGTGTDGTLGLKAIKGESGMAMVQQVQSAKFAGMPSSALATGLADFVLPPVAMPKQLVAYSRGPYLAPAPAVATEILPPEPMQKIFLLLRARTGHDFSAYKPSTIRRRIERRMNLQQLKAPPQYVRYLQENPNELDLLFKELLISVTHFFRDPEAFAVLAKSALPQLLKSRPDKYALRVWVPGCASGEEVFSLAILLRECLEELGRHFSVQMFGTDLDRAAIDGARAGRYPEGIAVDVSPPRLERAFVHEEGSYRIRNEVRELTIFATQNVIKDPPFTKLDLISCRNLLIYLNADLQKRLLPVFHYALKPGGLLLLGPSETIGSFTDLFEPVDKQWKIFRRKETALGTHPALELPSEAKAPTAERTPAVARPAKEASLATLVERLLLARCAPASVVVNERGDILYIHGRTGAFLEPTAGQPRLNILDMAREGLQLELAAALRQAAAGNVEVVRDQIRVRTNGDFIHVNMSVTRLLHPEALRGLLLVTVRPVPSAPAEGRPVQGHARPGAEAGRIAELERELQCTKAALQTTIEELETANEELKSTNEELQSTNEEIQSSNEELETSKEELQSLNEELTTVNVQMESKVEDLSRSNDDMQNLLNSIEIATLFLDNELNIQRYTAQAKRLVKLIPTDLGRPLGDLTTSLRYGHLVDDCREVLRTLAFKQVEVQTQTGHWYLMRILPYRTAENVIDGLVLTFVDITAVRQAQQDLRRMSKVFTDGLDPMIIVDLSDRIVDLNDEAVRLYGWSRPELLGQSVMLLVPKPQQKATADRLRRCRKGQTIRNVECVRVNKTGAQLKGLLTLTLLTDERGAPEAVAMIAKYIGT
jgi:two-component system CheB/CheR fusion protein